MSYRTASTLQYRYNLIEDFAQTMLPPTAQSLANCFSVVQNDREAQLSTELVTVSNQNNLLWISPDSASSSGWSHLEVLVDGAPGTNIQKIVSFYQGGVLYALALYDAGNGVSAVFGMQRTIATDWGKMPFDPDLQNALGQMRQSDCFRNSDDRHFFYGVSEGFQPPAFVLVGQDESSQAWVPFYMEPASSPTATYRMLPGHGGNQLTVVTIDGSSATFRGGSIVQGQLVWDGLPPVTHDLGNGPIVADQVVAIPSSDGSPGFLLRGADGQLFRVAGYDSDQLVVDRLTGGADGPTGVLSVVAGQAQQGLYMVFAIDNVDQRLWLLRQTPTQAPGAVLFDSWVALGNHLAVIGCPALMATGPELLLSDLEGNLCHFAQQVDQGKWFMQTIVSPSPATQALSPTTTFSTEFVTADGNGIMVPGTVVRIASDRPTVAVINGLSYHIDSVTPATVVSDAHGRVTVATISTSLVSPALIVSGAGIGTQGPFRCDLRVHQRLAGQDPTFPVNAASMKAAGLIPQTVGDDDADELASKVVALGAAAVAMHQSASEEALRASRAQAHSAFEIDFTRSSEWVRTLSGSEVSLLQSNVAVCSPSEIWGDVSNFFRHQIDDLKKLTISFADGVVNVALSLADGVKSFALRTLAEVGDCIEMFLQAVASLVADVEDAIDSAIRWLRALFSWDDILRTKRVVRHYIDQSIQNLTKDFNSTIPAQLIKAFTKAKADVVTVFDDLESLVAQGLQFSGLAPTASMDPCAAGGMPLRGVGLQGAYQANAVQCNYVHSKMSGSSNVADALRQVGDSPGLDSDQILQVFEQCFPMAELQQSWQKIQAFSSQIHDADSFMEVVILDLMEAAKDVVLLILGGVEAVLVAISEAMALALKGLNDLLSAPIDIPIISQLYRQMAGNDLTIVDLVSLVIAAPATLLYKVLYGGEQMTAPFSEADTQALEGSVMPWPSFEASTGVETRQLTAASSQDITNRAIAALFGISSFMYAILDVALDIEAASNIDVADAPTDETGSSILNAGIISIIVSVALQGFGVPYASMGRVAGGNDTKADTWTIVGWCTAWLPPLLDTVFALGSKSGKVTRLQGSFGPWLSMTAGAVMLGSGATAVHYMLQDSNYSKLNQAAMLLPTFPYIFQPVVLMGFSNPPAIACVTGLCVVDIASDVGTGLTTLLAASATSSDATNAPSGQKEIPHE